MSETGQNINTSHLEAIWPGDKSGFQSRMKVKNCAPANILFNKKEFFCTKWIWNVLSTRPWGYIHEKKRESGSWLTNSCPVWEVL